MNLLYALLLLAALTCFVVAAANYRQGHQGKTLLAAGLACWAAVALLRQLQML